MALKVENSDTAVAGKIDHRVFHADEERELDARFAELSGTDVHLPSWEGAEWKVPVGVERLTIAFGTFGSI